ncbi:MAG: DNA polymerase III subunit delta' [Polyangiaceae bacterium]
MAAILDTVLGQPVALATLRRGLALGKTHHAYLFEGPDGVGKETCAFGLAQALVCSSPRPSGDACGACSACERAVPRGEAGLPVHPDVVVLERGLYEPAQIGRKSPESKEISIDQVRALVLARAAFPPHEGRAKVFVVRRADELSISAANALLKTLEEPLSRTHFVLMTARKAALLSTIRSRTLSLRFGLLPTADVEAVLGRRGVDAATAKRVALVAGGSIATALELTDAEAHTEIEAFVSRMREARDAKDAGLGYALAEEGKKGKSELPALLAGLSRSFAETARDLALRGELAEAERDARSFSLVEAAIRKLAANGSPQLVVEGLVLGLRATSA